MLIFLGFCKVYFSDFQSVFLRFSKCFFSDLVNGKGWEDCGRELMGKGGRMLAG